MSASAITITLDAEERVTILRALEGRPDHTAQGVAIRQRIIQKLATATTPPDALALSVDALGLSVRAANCLHNAGIRTVGEVVARTDREFLRMNNLGRATLSEIRKAVALASVAIGAQP